ncbi:imidazolonepropionase [Paenibacillus solisilvae]|uniref:Imidazolonepropionase n=1 Tax=Paenibacillus solisilvae TaxID=2486751 RepID=A0ABW0W7N0_9BACL
MIYIRNASQLITVAGATAAPKRGREMEDLCIIHNGGLVIEEGRFTFVGQDDEAQRYVQNRAKKKKEVMVIDASGKVVTPGLVDPHTHLVFAGSRELELEMRLKGASYIDILKQGGGILSTAEQTRAASAEELAEQAKQRLDRFLLHGVTTIEAKSGYGLTVEDEIKQLRTARLLSRVHPVDIVSTFMGAHCVPKEYKNDPEAYVRLVTDDMIPLVAKEGLAEFCDVFCEQGVFTVEQSERILNAGIQAGLRPKIHADELEPFGGAELAARVGAVTADHLLKASDTGIRDLAKAGVIAVLLPGTAFFLMAEPAKARKMIEAGVPVALSTDRNPGSSPTESLQLIMNLACLTMRMTPAEVLTAVTINAAHALGRADRIGSIETGKQADLALFNAPNYVYLQYHYGINLVDTVIKNGIVAVSKGVITS